MLSKALLPRLPRKHMYCMHLEHPFRSYSEKPDRPCDVEARHRHRKATASGDAVKYMEAPPMTKVAIWQS